MPRKQLRHSAWIAYSRHLLSLALALINRINPIPNFEEGILGHEFLSRSLESRMLELSEAMELDEDRARVSPYRDFIAAASSRTNVKAQRETRIRWFLRVLDRAER
jgi:hypothetical protein